MLTPEDKSQLMPATQRLRDFGEWDLEAYLSLAKSRKLIIGVYFQQHDGHSAERKADALQKHIAATLDLKTVSRMRHGEILFNNGSAVLFFSRLHSGRGLTLDVLFTE